MKVGTQAEQAALSAHELDAFRDLNLTGIRQKVDEVLGFVGRGPCFRAYTRHDASHVDKMLTLLDWLVPDGTRGKMSPADWLLIVLAIYFHDVGMVVTDEEFDQRDQSTFRQFCDEQLFVGADGADYRAKVEELGDAAEAFLYEEFVRAHHGQRAAEWVRGKSAGHLGYSEAACSEVDAILRGLPSTFRDDLAKVCESHHLSDLWDTDKYRVEQPYGDSDSETANVQYAAALLRSADLLHITSERAPSILYRLINPQDPISQREWAKQASVRRVRSQKGLDRDGAFSDSAARDTVEVVAEFADAEGFFGLTSYLAYADGQLAQTRDWVGAASEKFDLPHRFPWRRIDDSQVTAINFSPNRLSFTLDQAKILDLLTGHTLYNDTSVVIRELVQNALDAVRLQALIDGVRSESLGVAVEWSEAERELVVRDEGTGMTQALIENNLLKAGSSRYQEDSFKKQYKDFSAISRFGIGVLSAFMIANEVEVVTVSPDEDQARSLTLRSVHGRYLVQLLDKREDERALRVGSHGTEIRLRLRDSANIPDVLKTLQRWIVIPRAKVTARIDDAEVVEIGVLGPKQAIEAVLKASGARLYDSGELENGMVRVVEYTIGGVTTAFVAVWKQFFREWAFYEVGELGSDDALRAIGTCVEGVRVEETTAGFDGPTIVALSNAVGPSAPKTNVARSGIEATPERTEMLRSIYSAYLKHVADEAQAIGGQRGHSLTWAAQEAELLLEPLTGADPRGDRSDVRAVQSEVLDAAIRACPIALVERDGERLLAPAELIDSEESIWTVDSAYVRAAERLLREVPGTRSLTSVSDALDSDAFSLPEGVTLIGYKGESPLYSTALTGWEVAEVVIRSEERRLDLRWMKTGASNWLSLVASRPQRSRRWSYGFGRQSCFVGCDPDGLEVVGRTSEAGIRAHGMLFLFGDTPIAQFLCDWIREKGPRSEAVRGTVADVVFYYLRDVGAQRETAKWVESYLVRESTSPFSDREQIERAINFDGLVAALDETPRGLFDTSAWLRPESFGW